MAANILAVALLCLGLGLTHAVPQVPCPDNSKLCLAKLFVKPTECDNLDPGTFAAIQNFTAPFFFNLVVSRRVVVGGIKEMHIQSFTFDPDTKRATLKTVVPSYVAKGYADLSVTDDQNKIHYANTTFDESLRSFVLTTEFEGPGLLDLARSTSSIPKDVLPVYSNLSYHKDLSDPAIAKLVEKLDQNRAKEAEYTNALRAQTLALIVYETIAC